LAQFSSELVCGGVGLDEAPEDAQTAEITSDERVRTKAPSFFFMTIPPRNRTLAYPRFGKEYTAAPAWIEAARHFQRLFRSPKEGCRSDNEIGEQRPLRYDDSVFKHGRRRGLAKPITIGRMRAIQS
jgi:hypothetical protein